MPAHKQALPRAPVELIVTTEGQERKATFSAKAVAEIR